MSKLDTNQKKFIRIVEANDPVKINMFALAAALSTSVAIIRKMGSDLGGGRKDKLKYPQHVTRTRVAGIWWFGAMQ